MRASTAGQRLWQNHYLLTGVEQLDSHVPSAWPHFQHHISRPQSSLHKHSSQDNDPHPTVIGLYITVPEKLHVLLYYFYFLIYFFNHAVDNQGVLEYVLTSVLFKVNPWGGGDVVNTHSTRLTGGIG